MKSLVRKLLSLLKDEKGFAKMDTVVDTDYCTGFGICVEACGPKCLEIVNGVVVLIQSDRCGSEEHCIEPCPLGCIRMQCIEASGDESVGKRRTILV